MYVYTFTSHEHNDSVSSHHTLDGTDATVVLFAVVHHVWHVFVFFFCSWCDMDLKKTKILFFSIHTCLTLVWSPVSFSSDKFLWSFIPDLAQFELQFGENDLFNKLKPEPSENWTQPSESRVRMKDVMLLIKGQRRSRGTRDKRGTKTWLRVRFKASNTWKSGWKLYVVL